MICPICNSPNTKKNGTKLLVTGNRTQEFHCQGCGKYFSFQIDVGEQHRLKSVEPGDILVVDGGKGIRVHGLTDVLTIK